MPVLISFCAATSALAQFIPPDPNTPITGDEQVKWAIYSTVGPDSLFAGLFSAGWGTLLDQPHEYGTHWLGFGKRYGMRLTGIATSNVMEAGLGAIAQQDPRYHRAPEGEPFPKRMGHVMKMTFMAENRDGDVVPAFARYAAISGSNFLSNSWRPNSEANTSHAIVRIGLGFAGRFTSNALDEFWPDVRDRVFHFGR
jgi:hypothetical protein